MKVTRLSLLLLLVVLTPVLLEAQARRKPPLDGTLEGRVRSRITGAPVAGAQVWLTYTTHGTVTGTGAIA